MEHSIDIVVSGHLCLDLLPKMDNLRLSDLTSPGRLFEIGPMIFSTGGAVSNTGLALHRLGTKASLMSNVGGDLIGRLIIAYLESHDPSFGRAVHVREGQASAYTVVLSPENVDRIFLHCTGTNASFTSTDIDYDLAGQARIFHLGYPPLLPALTWNDGAALEAIFSRVHRTNTVTSLDTSLPDPDGASGAVNWRALLRHTLPYIDIFIPSLEEILFMLRRADFERWHPHCGEYVSLRYLDDLTTEMMALGAMAVVGVKLGDRGIYIHSGTAERFARISEILPIRVEQWSDQKLWHPAFEVNVVGTTGAGDSAYAGFLTAMLKGLSMQEATRWACAVGACNVEAPDAISGVRSWEATQRRMDHGWKLSTRRLIS